MTLQSAKVILTGYDKPKIKESVKMIIDYSKKNNLQVMNSDSKIESKAKLWGCEKNNIEQEIIFLSGTMDNLQKILYVKTKNGIYLQLLLQ